MRLKVKGSERYLVLEDDANGQLKKALEKGIKRVSVSGRLETWKGNFTQLSKNPPKRPYRLAVKDVQAAPK
jgi:hypothetical protein